MPTRTVDEMAVSDDGSNVGKHLHNLWIIHVRHLSIRLPCDSPMIFPSWYTIFPRKNVAAGLPMSSNPSYADQRFLVKRSSFFTFHACTVSTTTMSASLPTARPPFCSKPKILAMFCEATWAIHI